VRGEDGHPEGLLSYENREVRVPLDRPSGRHAGRGLIVEAELTRTQGAAANLLRLPETAQPLIRTAQGCVLSSLDGSATRNTVDRHGGSPDWAPGLFDACGRL